jgi:hypothetical protein
MTRIEKYFLDANFVKDVIIDNEQYIIYENEQYYEIYIYKQCDDGLYLFDQTVFDILKEHYIIPKKLFKLI